MGVHRRKRAKGNVYGINFMVNGRQVQEIVGTDKREAERLYRQRMREVAQGVYVPHARGANISVQRYAELWLERRVNITTGDDAQRLRDHVLPRVGALRLSEIEQPDVVRLVRDLQADSAISLKTAKNSYGVFRTMMRDATIERLVLGGDPCVLPKGSWRKQAPVEREVYTAHEVVRFLTDEKLDWDRRVLFALWFYTGCREGEGCGLTWTQWRRDVAPLGALAIDWQYDHKPLKTNNPRRVPVHPHLAEILTRWFTDGFALIYGRRPTSKDWIVPRRRAPERPHTKSSAYKAFVAACETLGIEARSLHATRHTMITWARRGGADRDVLEKITHNAKGQIIDAYTHWDWEPLCVKAVLKLDYLGAAGVRQLVAHGILPDTDTDTSPEEGEGYVGVYVASPGEAEIPVDDGGGAGNRTRRIGRYSWQKQANGDDDGGGGEPSGSRQLAQAGAAYAAHHRRGVAAIGAGGETRAELALAAALEVATEERDLDAILAVTAELRERRLERLAPQVPSLEQARRARKGAKP